MANYKAKYTKWNPVTLVWDTFHLKAYDSDMLGGYLPSSFLMTSGGTLTGSLIIWDGVSNHAKIKWNIDNAGSPQMEFSDADNDLYWAVGADDTSTPANSFKIHGSASAMPTLNGLATPFFEITTAGAILNSGQALVKTNDSRLIFDDTPVDGQTVQAISSNWAFNHNAGTGNGKHVPTIGTVGHFLKHDGTFGLPAYIPKLTTEEVQDIIGGMINVSASQTGMSVAYNDTTGKIDIDLSHTHTDNNTTYTFAIGTTNGTFNVTPSGGSLQAVPIFGLGSAAYTASTAYAAAAHTAHTRIDLSTMTPSTTAGQLVYSGGSLYLGDGTNIRQFYHAGNNNIGTGATNYISATDSKLSDARTPIAHTQAWSTITSTPTTTSGYGLPAYPTTLPASDVYAWAKASVKPTYTASDVGALAVGAKAADSNLLDGLDSTKFLRKDTADSYYGLYQAATGNPISNLGNPTVTEMALFQEQFNNKTEFYTIANLKFYTSTDNVNWTEYTSFSDTDKKKFLGGDNSSGINIPNLTPYFRIEITNNGNYVYLNALYMYWSSNSHSTKVKIRIQRCDGVWYQCTNSENIISSWPGHLYLPFDTIPFNPSTTSTSHYRTVHIDFTPTWSGHATYGTYPISLYKLQIWGGYPAGKRTVYSVDENRNVYFPGQIIEGSNRVYSAGNTNIGTGATNYKAGNYAPAASEVMSLGASYRWLTDTYISTWNAKEPAITKGTTAQYFRGDMSLVTFPTTLPASDVYAWAKASTKPSYTASEVGADTSAQVNAKIAALVDSSPGTLDTLNELAAALGDDPNFATTVTTAIGTKLPLTGGTISGATIFNSGAATSPELKWQNQSYIAGIDLYNNSQQLRFIDITNSAERISFYLDSTPEITIGGQLVVKTNDARLSDARTPITHTHDDRYYTETESNANFLGKTAKAADSTLADGVAVSATTVRNNVANKVVTTNASGYADFGWINTTSGATTNAVTDVYVNTNDGYIRKKTLALFKTELGSMPASDVYSWAKATSQPAPIAHTQAWSTITSAPTTTSGYGITDAASSTHSHGLVSASLAAASNIDALTASNFRTTLFGVSTSGNQLSVARWNTSPAILGMQSYGTMIAWGASDTQAFLAIDYATSKAKIGGGSADLINWSQFLVLDSDTSTTATANKIVKRDANGYIYGVYINSSRDNETSAAASYIYDSGDGWMRKKTLANAKTELVTKAAIEAVLTGAITTHTHAYLTSTLSANLNANSYKITSLANPTLTGDAVNLSYLQTNYRNGTQVVSDINTNYALGVKEDNAETDTRIWVGTQAQYNNLATKYSTYLYFITA